MSTDTTSEVQFLTGPQEAGGRRVVTAARGDEELCRHKFDTNNQNQRKRFAAQVAEQIGQPSRAPALCWMILSAADRTDELCIAAGEQDDMATNCRRGGSQASQLVAIAESAELFRTPDGVAYGTFHVGGHGETCAVRSRSFTLILQRCHYATHGTTANAQAMQDALSVLEGQALFGGMERKVFTRFADEGRQNYLDLANSTWSGVSIDAEGLRTVNDLPVKFRRPKGLLALPTPVRGGTLEELFSFLNVAPEDWPLVLGWLVAAARPRGPYPVLSLNGEQGCAKSTVSKVLRRMIDPSTADLRAEPRDIRDLVISANNSWIVPLDNMSYVQPWLSDGLCRLATGGGFATRALYSDDEEVLFEVQRPMIINGIEELGTRSDLLDRSIQLTLMPIASQRRRTEADFWRDFEIAHPRMLGALLDAVVIAMRNLPNTRLTDPPRMADFATWGVAAEPGLPIARGAFLFRYASNREAAHELALEGSALTAPLRRLMSARAEWEGTATDLHNALSRLLVGLTLPAPRSWPANAQKLSAALRRLATNLSAVGCRVEFGRGRARLIRITATMPSADAVVPGPRGGPDLPNAIGHVGYP